MCHGRGKVHDSEVHEDSEELFEDISWGNTFLGSFCAETITTTTGMVENIKLAGTSTDTAWKVDTGTDVSCYPAEWYRPEMGHKVVSDKRLFLHKYILSCCLYTFTGATSVGTPKARSSFLQVLLVTCEVCSKIS